MPHHTLCKNLMTTTTRRTNNERTKERNNEQRTERHGLSRLHFRQFHERNGRLPPCIEKVYRHRAWSESLTTSDQCYIGSLLPSGRQQPGPHRAAGNSISRHNG